MFGHGGGGGNDVKMLKNNWQKMYYKNVLGTYFVQTCR